MTNAITCGKDCILMSQNHSNRIYLTRALKEEPESVDDRLFMTVVTMVNTTVKPCKDMTKDNVLTQCKS